MTAFLDAIITHRHPEERRAARLEGRRLPVQLHTMTAISEAAMVHRKR
jgi:hypothetical protein